MIFDIVTRPDVVALYQEIVDGLNRELSQFERIKRIALLPSEFTVESGELTPTLTAEADELVGTSIASLLHADDLPLYRSLQPQRERGEDLRYEARMRTRHGAWPWMSIPRTWFDWSRQSASVISRSASERSPISSCRQVKFGMLGVWP